MAALFNRMRSGATTAGPLSGSSPSKKDSNAQQLTPLEKHLQDYGPLREDGSDKFWGMENIGATCYANSIIQSLYYSVPFRQQVINYPQPTPQESVINGPNGQQRLQANTTSLALNHPSLTYAKLMNNRQMTQNASARNPAASLATPKPADKDHPDFKKRIAQTRGPTIAMEYENASVYGMPESLFTSLKDIFEALYVHESRTGVVKPARFLEILRRDHTMFATPQHQDAHEFLNLVLNNVLESVEAHAKKLKNDGDAIERNEKSEFERALAEAMPELKNQVKWAHDLFEGTLVSETKCLTCENASQRDEKFLDLSIDLEEHASVTSCLRKFSEEEMLCERNKFHCDICGGLQEAEKRMKIKRLPRILALHLKRFKFTDDYIRLQKLFHRVVYPYHLRLFNTTDDADDPDRLYELYAVVVHIGNSPYHGHYVSIIKTEDRGWLLFDDELVEPVDKNYVQNFFGGGPGIASAYVLFYQETTLEAVRREQEAESQAMAAKALVPVKETVGLGVKSNGFLGGLYPVKSAMPPTSPEEGPETLNKVISEPLSSIHPILTNGQITALPPMPITTAPNDESKSKKDRQKEEKERKAAARLQTKEDEKVEKGRRKTVELMRRETTKKQEAEAKQASAASKTPKTDEDKRTVTENGTVTLNGLTGSLSRSKFSSKSFRKPKFLSSREAGKDEPVAEEHGTISTPHQNSDEPEKAVDKPPDKAKSRLSNVLKKKASFPFS